MPPIAGIFSPRARPLKKAARLAGFTAALLLASVTGPGLLAASAITSETSEIELTNFAFANYLGSGLYSSGDKKLFIMNPCFASGKLGSVLRSYRPIFRGVKCEARA